MKKVLRATAISAVPARPTSRVGRRGPSTTSLDWYWVIDGVARVVGAIAALAAAIAAALRG